MVQNIFRNIFTPIRPIPAGMYHYQAPANDPRNYRLHLRLEPDGTGVLIVNAATVLHLNHTAAEYAYYLVQNLPSVQAARQMSQRYHVRREQALQDYQELSGRIMALIDTPDLAPETFLDFDRQAPFSSNLSAPFRLDCAITYSLPDTASTSIAPMENVTAELSTAEWQVVLDKAWQAGIPHVVFTGGEPTLREDLPALIAHAESLGQVSGLLSDGLRLDDKSYLEDLLQTGLDHLMIILQPANPRAWKALEYALVDDLFTAVHLTLDPDIALQAAELLKRLAGMGVKAVSLSASDPSLSAALRAAREQAAQLNLELVWNLPVPYSALHPVAIEIQELRQNGLPEGAGRAWLYVEPDGDVLASQGAKKVLGNLLRDPWEKIWAAR